MIVYTTIRKRFTLTLKKRGTAALVITYHKLLNK